MEIRKYPLLLAFSPDTGGRESPLRVIEIEKRNGSNQTPLESLLIITVT